MTEENEVTETEAEATETEATEPKVDSRHKYITTPVFVDDVTGESVGGERVARTKYIARLWTEGLMTRSDIRKHINDDCTADDGENVIEYQIVFAATKNVTGGPSDELLADRKAEKDAVAAEAKAEKKAVKDAAKQEADAAKAEAAGDSETDDSGAADPASGDDAAYE